MLLVEATVIVEILVGIYGVKVDTLHLRLGIRDDGCERAQRLMLKRRRRTLLTVLDDLPSREGRLLLQKVWFSLKLIFAATLSLCSLIKKM